MDLNELPTWVSINDFHSTLKKKSVSKSYRAWKPLMCINTNYMHQFFLKKKLKRKLKQSRLPQYIIII